MVLHQALKLEYLINLSDEFLSFNSWFPDIQTPFFHTVSILTVSHPANMYLPCRYVLNYEIELHVN